jgi:hypothetical protein
MQNNARRLVTDAVWYPQVPSKAGNVFPIFRGWTVRYFRSDRVIFCAWLMASRFQVHSYTFRIEIRTFCLASIITLSQLTNSRATLL